MAEMSLQRRKVVVLCACVAIFAGQIALIQKVRPTWLPFWIGLIVGLAIYAGTQFVKLKKEERR